MSAAQSAPVALDAAASRFVVVEDDTLFRELLRDALRRWFRPRELIDFDSGRPAVDCIVRAPADLIVTDLRLPDIDGRELIRQIRMRGQETRIVVVTGLRDGVLPAQLMALGVAGFVDKGSPLDHLRRAVKRVLEGGMYFTAGVMPATTAVFTAVTDPGSSVMLTPRERIIARLIVQGLSSKEIGARLEIGTRSIEKQRARLMQKMRVRDLAGMVRWCLHHGLG